MIIGIDHIALTVEDAGRATTDYTAVLGRKGTFDGAAQQPGFARLQLDNVAIAMERAASVTETAETASSIRLGLISDSTGTKALDFMAVICQFWLGAPLVSMGAR